jgi:tyrosine-protein kinase Etk/Wzc
MQDEAKDFRVYGDVIYRKKWLILFIFLVVFLAALYFVRQQHPAFTSSSSVYFESSNPAAAVLSVNPDGQGGRPLQFYMGIFDSRSFRKNVKQATVQHAISLGMPAYEASELTDEAMASLQVKGTKNQGYYTISTVAESPDIAYAADSLATYLFAERCILHVRQQTNAMTVFVEMQFDSARARLERAEDRLQTYRKQNNLLQVGASAASDPSLPIEYVRLVEGYYDARRERQAAQAALEAAAEAARLLKISLDSLASDKVGRALPSLDLAEVLERTRKARIDLQLKELQEQSFQAQLQAYEAANPELSNVTLGYLRLVREREIHLRLADLLLERREELRVKSASESGGVRVIDAPSPATPTASRSSLILVFAAIAGLGLGVGAAFGLEFMDTSIHTVSHVAAAVGVAAIGAIPTIGVTSGRKRTGELSRRRALISEGSPKDPVAEAYRTLRTSLLYSVGDQRLRSLVVSSAGQSEGKSITVANLGIVCAQMGQRTVIVDADLRRPVQHILFDVEREDGLTEAIVHSRDLIEMAKPTGIDNLDVITCGIIPPNPATLLASKAMKELIEQLKNQYDLVLFDTPPIIVVTDAVLVARLTDGILMVVRCNATPREAAQHAAETLSNAGVPLLGAVLNDIDITRRYGGYAYHNYYYQYYYSGSEDSKKSPDVSQA